MIKETITELVKVEWSYEDQDYPYQDTFLFTKSEYDSLSAGELEQMELAKYNEWKDYITSN